MSKYKDALSAVKASESFRRDTVMKMREKEVKTNKCRPHRFLPRALAGTAIVCLALVLVIGGTLRGRDRENPWTPSGDLPVISITWGVDPLPESYGIIQAYDISQLENENPWSEDSEITHLPVYRGKPLRTGDRLRPYYYYLTEEEMVDIADEIAESMGVTVKEYEISPTQEELDYIEEERKKLSEALSSQYPPEDIYFKDKVMDDRAYSVGSVWEDFTIQVYTNGLATWVSGDTYPLTENGFGREGTTVPEAKMLVKTFIDEYPQILDMEAPAAEVKSQYSSTGDCYLQCFVYDSAGEDLRERIINYNFSRMSVYSTYYDGVGIDASGIINDVLNFRVGRTWDDVIGEYPVISLSEAKEQLFEGNYISGMDLLLIGASGLSEERIAKCELVYADMGQSMVVVPFYRFYLDVEPEMLSESLTAFADEGMKYYAIYDVPAISSEYIVLSQGVYEPESDYEVFDPFEPEAPEAGNMHEYYYEGMELLLKDYNMEKIQKDPSYEYSAESLEGLPGMSAEELLEYYRCADGIYSEGAASMLVRRFLENPDNMAGALAKASGGDEKLRDYFALGIGSYANFWEVMNSEFIWLCKEMLNSDSPHLEIYSELYHSYYAPMSLVHNERSAEYLSPALELIGRGDTEALVQWMDFDGSGDESLLDYLRDIAEELIGYYSEYDLSSWTPGEVSSIRDTHFSKGTGGTQFFITDANGRELSICFTPWMTPEMNMHYLPKSPGD